MDSDSGQILAERAVTCLNKTDAAARRDLLRALRHALRAHPEALAELEAFDGSDARAQRLRRALETVLAADAAAWQDVRIAVLAYEVDTAEPPPVPAEPPPLPAEPLPAESVAPPPILPESVPPPSVPPPPKGGGGGFWDRFLEGVGDVFRTSGRGTTDGALPPEETGAAPDDQPLEATPGGEDTLESVEPPPAEFPAESVGPPTGEIPTTNGDTDAERVAADEDGEVITASLNASFEALKTERRLQVGVASDLVFAIAGEAVVGSGQAAAIIATRFDADVDEIPLTIQLDSDDVDIDGAPTREIVFRRDRTSREPATFTITPRHAGTARLLATVLANGNFLQQLTLVVPVAETAPPAEPAPDGTVESEQVGRSLDAARSLGARDLAIVFRPTGVGFECTVTGMFSASVVLPITDIELGAAVDDVRKALGGVVSKAIFQQGIDIPDADRDAALDALALEGLRLFQRLFFHDASTDDEQRIGRFLVETVGAASEPLKVQFLTAGLTVPWPALYIARDLSEPVDWRRFLGLAHDLEEIPLRMPPNPPPALIDSGDAGLAVALHFDHEIDEEMGLGIIARQDEYWTDAATRAPGIRLTRRTHGAELVTGLGADAPADHVLYFLCHAAAVGGVSSSADDSWLALTDQVKVTVKHLQAKAATHNKLPAHPLVFINACESAELSPLFYAGFAPYFLAKGARGVIGTECKIPAILADDFARRFFDGLLRGDPLGATILRVRRELVETHGNPLGLAYGVHSDADITISPALLSTE